MEIGSTARASVVSPSLGDTLRAAPAARTDAVRTELPPEAAVRQPAVAAETEGRPSSGGATTSFLDSSISVDLETRKVVFQEVDSRTGDVVVQIPDPRYLRAYAAQLKAADSAPPQDGAIERLA